MKLNFRMGKLEMKIMMKDPGDVEGLHYLIDGIDQEIDISKEEFPEIAKYLLANRKETLEFIKVLREEIIQGVKEIKAILSEDEYEGGLNALERQVNLLESKYEGLKGIVDSETEPDKEDSLKKDIPSIFGTKI